MVPSPQNPTRAQNKNNIKLLKRVGNRANPSQIGPVTVSRLLGTTNRRGIARPTRFLVPKPPDPKSRNIMAKTTFSKLVGIRSHMVVFFLWAAYYDLRLAFLRGFRPSDPPRPSATNANWGPQMGGGRRPPRPLLASEPPGPKGLGGRRHPREQLLGSGLARIVGSCPLG